MNEIATEMQIDTEDLRDSAQRVLSKLERHAPYSETGAGDDAALRATIAELGWMLLTVPEEFDGLGQTFVALAPIYEELGRALAQVAYAGTMAAVDVLNSTGSHDLLPLIGAGEAVIAVALARTGDVEVQASGPSCHVTGSLRNVLDAGEATHLLIAPTGPGLPVVLVEMAQSGISRTIVETWDRTRELGDVAMTGAAGTVLSSGAQAQEAGTVAQAHLDLAIACDSLGGAEQALAEAIEYMGTRHQFNRPIGSFQALKHRAADLKVGLELARAFTADACKAFAERRDGWANIAGQAKLIAADAYRAVAEESVQFHGGIGFTWEHDCHLFLKRALLNEMLGGTPEQYRDRVAPDILRRAFAGRQ